MVGRAQGLESGQVQESLSDSSYSLNRYDPGEYIVKRVFRG
jgi:hypothetical protein